jgi:hypothetical protein
MSRQKGARITALRHRDSKHNLLCVQRPEGRVALGGNEQYPIAGWDEVLPSLEPEGKTPAMGWPWKTTAETSHNDQGDLVTSWRIPDFHLRRTLSIRGQTLRVNVSITNTSPEAKPFIWASHVLFAWHRLREAVLPHGTILPGPQCDLPELRRRIHERPQGRSWKFYLPSSAPIQLFYNSSVVTLDTRTSWWGVWLNQGAHNTRCLGLEPTNDPSDFGSDCTAPLRPGHTREMQWQLTITPRQVAGA